MRWEIQAVTVRPTSDGLNFRLHAPCNVTRVRPPGTPRHQVHLPQLHGCVALPPLAGAAMDLALRAVPAGDLGHRRPVEHLDHRTEPMLHRPVFVPCRRRFRYFDHAQRNDATVKNIPGPSKTSCDRQSCPATSASRNSWDCTRHSPNPVNTPARTTGPTAERRRRACSAAGSALGTHAPADTAASPREGDFPFSSRVRRPEQERETFRTRR